MPRAPRVSFQGFPHVVIAHANGGVHLFYHDDDYSSYLQHLRQLVRDRMLNVYAFCLVRDELRLVVRPLKLPLSRIVQKLHTRHTLRVNNRLKRKGHLFAGRFRSLVFPEEELGDVIRGVHLWPVRAGLIRRPEGYSYSSHPAYLTNTHPLRDILDCSSVLSRFAENPQIAQRSFARFVELAALEDDNLGVNEVAPGIAGHGRHVDELLAKNKAKGTSKKRVSLALLAKRVSLLVNVNVQQLKANSRRQDLVMARRLFSAAAVIGAERSNTEVAAFINRDKAQVSRLVSQGMDLIEYDTPFRVLFETVSGKSNLKTLNETKKVG